MKRKTLFNAARIVLFLGLMAWVVDRIELNDAARPAAEASWQAGDLAPGREGGWVFTPEGGTPRELRPGAEPGTWREAAAGDLWEIRRGFLPRLRGMDLGLLGLAALTYFLCASFAALRWHWLLKANDLPVSLWEAWRLNWVGVFFNNIVPGLTGGDVVKAYYIARHTGKKTVPILTVVVDRVLGLAALALLALGVVVLNLARFQKLALGIVGLLAAVAFVTVLFFSRRVRRALRVGRLLRRLPGASVLMRIDEALTFYRNKKGALAFWLLASVANHILSTGFVAILGLGLAYHVSWIDYFVLVPIINIASSAPVAPAGWGVGEALYDWAFTTFSGLGPGEGAGLSAVSRVLVTAWSLLGGILLLFMKDRVSARVIAAEMEAAAPPPPGE